MAACWLSVARGIPRGVWLSAVVARRPYAALSRIMRVDVRHQESPTPANTGDAMTTTAIPVKRFVRMQPSKGSWFLTVRRQGELTTGSAVHARLGLLALIAGDAVDDPHPGRVSFLGDTHRQFRAFQRVPCRQ